MRRSFQGIIFTALLLSQLAIAQQNTRTIFLVRHAEKLSAAPDALLSPAGEKRAECLAHTLKDSGITQIYVTEVKRTQQTAAPLAKALKITPTVSQSRDTATLARNLLYGQGNILVIGHSNTVPVLLAQLQGGKTVENLGDNDYDKLFIVTVNEGSGSAPAMVHYCEPNPTTAPGGMRPPASKKSSAPQKKK